MRGPFTEGTPGEPAPPPYPQAGPCLPAATRRPPRPAPRDVPAARGSSRRRPQNHATSSGTRSHRSGTQIPPPRRAGGRGGCHPSPRPPHGENDGEKGGKETGGVGRVGRGAGRGGEGGGEVGLLVWRSDSTGEWACEWEGGGRAKMAAPCGLEEP